MFNYDELSLIDFLIAFAAASSILIAPTRVHAAAEDVLQAAVNNVFTGLIAPENGPKIVDIKSCVVVMSDQRNKGTSKNSSVHEPVRVYCPMARFSEHI